ncbi:MAG: hypothetical protein GEU93_18865 [Propionibacteriales bacterium]|nr:hypothetical protein [Propionibacteriales bacterium]
MVVPGSSARAPLAVGASFQGLGHLPGGSASFAGGVSGDGSVVVGRGDSSESIQRAFRWTAAGGLEDIGTLGGSGATAQAVSFDGTWIVGQSGNGFRWNSATGMQELPMADALDVSDDGSVVVAFGLRWRNGEVTSLGGSSGCLCSAHGVSGDGGGRGGLVLQWPSGLEAGHAGLPMDRRHWAPGPRQPESRQRVHRGGHEPGWVGYRRPG